MEDMHDVIVTTVWVSCVIVFFCRERLTPEFVALVFGGTFVILMVATMVFRLAGGRKDD